MENTVKNIVDPLARTVPSIATGMRILLVDKDTTSLMCMSSILESHSYKVTTMELASIAVSMFADRRDEYDVVLADMNMSDMSRMDFLRGILISKITTPVIFMTTMGNLELAKQVMEEGACHLMVKPISSGRLQQVWQFVHRETNSIEEKEEEEEKKEKEKKEDCEVNVKHNDENQGEGGGSRATRALDVDKKLEGSKARGKAAAVSRPKRSKGIVIREGANIDRRPAIRTCSQGIDPKGKNKQVHSDYSLASLGLHKPPLGLRIGDMDQFRMAAHEINSNIRKRSEDDNGGGQKYQRNVNSQNPSCKGKAPMVEFGNDSAYGDMASKGWRTVVNSNYTEAIRKLSEEVAMQKAIQDSLNTPNLTQHQISSNLQRYKGQVQSMLGSYMENTPPVGSAGNVPGLNTNGRRGIPQSQEQLGSSGSGARSSSQWGLGDGRRHAETSQARERNPFPIDNKANNEYGKWEQTTGLQGNNHQYLPPEQSPLQNLPNQYYWQNPTTPLTDLSRMPGMNSAIQALNTNAPAGTISDDRGEAMPSLANRASSSTQVIPSDPATNHVLSGEEDVEWLTEWLRKSLNDDDDDHLNMFGKLDM